MSLTAQPSSSSSTFAVSIVVDAARSSGSEYDLKRDIWTRNHGGQLLARKAVGTTLDEKVGFLAPSSLKLPVRYRPKHDI